jgi:hypothetical protein
MGYNATVVVCLDQLHSIKEDPNFGDGLSQSILKVTNRGVQEGPHGTVVVEAHHADYLVPVIVGGNYGRVMPGLIGIDSNEHVDATNVRVLKEMAKELGYRVSKIPVRKGIFK